MRRMSSSQPNKAYSQQTRIVSQHSDPTNFANQVENKNKLKKKLILASSCLALITVVFQVIIVETNYISTLKTEPELSRTLKGVNSILVLVGVGLLWQEYRLAFDVEKRTMAAFEGDTLWTKKYVHWFILEAAVLALHSPMNLDFEVKTWTLSPDDSRKGWRHISYKGEEIVLAFMFLKLFFAWKLAKDLSPFTNETSRTIAVWYEEDLTHEFIGRALMLQRPFGAIGSVVLVISGALAYLIFIFERRVDGSAINDFSKSIWMTILTVTTIGYGDVVPYSVPGRLVAAALCFASLASLSLALLSATRVFELTQRQRKVVHLLEHAQLRQQLKGKAASVIARAWELHVETASDATTGLEDSKELAAQLRDFRQLRKKCSVPSDQGSDLLFKEMLTMREQTETMFVDLNKKVESMEGSMTEMINDTDQRFRDISDRLQQALKSIQSK